MANRSQAEIPGLISGTGGGGSWYLCSPIIHSSSRLVTGIVIRGTAASESASKGAMLKTAWHLKEPLIAQKNVHKSHQRLVRLASGLHGEARLAHAARAHVRDRSCGSGTLQDHPFEG